MGIIRQLADLQLGSINTTKVLVITNSETFYQIGSGNRAVEAFITGTNAIVFYGQSNLLATSGNFINTSGGAKFWDTVTDDFSMYFVVSSTTQNLIIHEYAGN